MKLFATVFTPLVAVLAFSAAHAFSDVVNATYTTGAEVLMISNGFTAIGKSVNIKLDFAPSPGAQLMVVRNTGPGIIRGRFSNLMQGQTVALSYGGITYHFVANYYGGKGNDLVLLWTTGEELIRVAILNKLDGQLVLALKKSRGQPPFDKPTTLEPDIPIKDGSRVLVDITGSVSKELLDRVALLGGQTIKGAEMVTTFRAMVPLSQLEALAGRADVTFISPARLAITSTVEGSPSR
jgi:hypothetical protein